MNWSSARVYSDGRRWYFGIGHMERYLVLDTYVQNIHRVRVVLEMRDQPAGTTVLAETICAKTEVKAVVTQYKEIGESRLMEALL